jgi:hypothetical protein
MIQPLPDPLVLRVLRDVCIHVQNSDYMPFYGQYGAETALLCQALYEHLKQEVEQARIPWPRNLGLEEDASLVGAMSTRVPV